jgi:hypothetical protein
VNVRRNIRGVPEGIWVGRVEASHHDPAVAYVVFDGHRSDVFTPWVFKTADYGRTWTRITSGIPDGQSTYVIREDPRNPNLLFLGTEFGLFVSLNGGTSWTMFRNGFPTVAVHDLVIHPRDHDLVIGTHGRSLWIVDDITPLQQLTGQVRSADAHLFAQPVQTLWENTSRGGQRGHFWFGGENPPTIESTSSIPRAEFRNLAQVTYYLGTAAREATLEIATLSGLHSVTLHLNVEPGVHRVMWDLQFDPPPFTEEQRQTVTSVFQRALGTGFGGQQLERAYQRFQNAQTPLEEREAMQILLSPFVESGLGDEYRIPTAGPGTYRLTLTVDGSMHRGTLTIRPDPLLAEGGER